MAKKKLTIKKCTCGTNCRTFFVYKDKGSDLFSKCQFNLDTIRQHKGCLYDARLHRDCMRKPCPATREEIKNALYANPEVWLTILKVRADY